MVAMTSSIVLSAPRCQARLRPSPPTSRRRAVAMRTGGAGMPQILVVCEGGWLGRREKSLGGGGQQGTAGGLGAEKVTKRRGVKVRRCGGHQ